MAHDLEGTITRLVGAAFNVTPIRQAEQHLREADGRKDMHLAMRACGRERAVVARRGAT